MNNDTPKSMIELKVMNYFLGTGDENKEVKIPIDIYCNWNVGTRQGNELINHAQILIGALELKLKENPFFIDFDDVTFIEAGEDDGSYRVYLYTVRKEQMEGHTKSEELGEMLRKQIEEKVDTVLELYFGEDDDKNLLGYSLVRYGDKCLGPCTFEDILDFMRGKFDINQLHHIVRFGDKLFEMPDTVFKIQEQLDLCRVIMDCDSFLEGNPDLPQRKDDDTYNTPQYRDFLVRMYEMARDYARRIEVGKAGR